MPNEFDIIKKYFTPVLTQYPEVILGVGDDAAIWQVDATAMVTSVDTLLIGRHFFPDCKPEDLAYKALAVNISDFAAMGATPRWFTLALTLPEANMDWLQKFSDSLLQTASTYHLALIGGDTTQGPLSVTLQIIGTLDKNKALLRSGAQVGDSIYVSNVIGDAACALQYLQGHAPAAPRDSEPMLAQLHRPVPQLALGQALVGYAHAAIDISDGLAQDLQHILTASGVGAEIDFDKIPISVHSARTLGIEKARALALCGGDDYQLCFTMPAQQKRHVILPQGVEITCIGEIKAQLGLQILQYGLPYTQTVTGFVHFGKDDPPPR